jgi:hypothetical protein
VKCKIGLAGGVASGFVWVQSPLYEILLIPKYISSIYDVFPSEKVTRREILREVTAETSLVVEVANVNTAEKYYCLLHHSSGIDIWCEPGKDEDNWTYSRVT